MSFDEALSREVAGTLSQTAVRAFKMPTERIVPAFDEAQATCLTLVSSKELELEVRRRVAEWKMRLLCDRDASFEIVERLHNEILGLGYSNLEIKGGTEIYFAQYCMRQNQADVAWRTLHQLCSKLDDFLTAHDLEVCRHFREVSEDLLAKIDT